MWSLQWPICSFALNLIGRSADQALHPSSGVQAGCAIRPKSFGIKELVLTAQNALGGLWRDASAASATTITVTQTGRGEIQGGGMDLAGGRRATAYNLGTSTMPRQRTAILDYSGTAVPATHGDNLPRFRTAEAAVNDVKRC